MRSIATYEMILKFRKYFVWYRKYLAWNRKYLAWTGFQNGWSFWEFLFWEKLLEKWLHENSATKCKNQYLTGQSKVSISPWKFDPKDIFFQIFGPTFFRIHGPGLTDFEVNEPTRTRTGKNFRQGLDQNEKFLKILDQFGPNLLNWSVNLWPWSKFLTLLVLIHFWSAYVRLFTKILWCSKLRNTYSKLQYCNNVADSMMQHFCNNYCKNFINYRLEQTDFTASCTMLHNVLYLGFTCDNKNAILHEDYPTARLSI